MGFDEAMHLITLVSVEERRHRGQSMFRHLHGESDEHEGHEAKDERTPLADLVRRPGGGDSADGSGNVDGNSHKLGFALPIVELHPKNRR